MTNYDNRLDQILSDCLKQIDSGDLTIENCLESYPEYREDLTKMLPVALYMRQNSEVQPSNIFQQKALGRLQKRLEHNPRLSYQDRTKKFISTLPWVRGRQTANQRRFSLIGIVVAIVLSFVLTTGGALAANSAGPGDLLYGLDLAVEQFRLELATDDDKIVELELEFAAERLHEAEDELEGEADHDEIEQALDSFDEAIAALEALLDSLTPEQQVVVQATISTLQELRDTFDEFELEIEFEDGELEIELELENHDEDDDADHDDGDDADHEDGDNADHDDGDEGDDHDGEGDSDEDDEHHSDEDSEDDESEGGSSDEEDD